MKSWRWLFMSCVFFVALDWRAEWQLPYHSPPCEGGVGGVVSDLPATIISNRGWSRDISYGIIKVNG
jgi:hypothetical protein